MIITTLITLLITLLAEGNERLPDRFVWTIFFYRDLVYKKFHVWQSPLLLKFQVAGLQLSTFTKKLLITSVFLKIL